MRCRVLRVLLILILVTQLASCATTGQTKQVTPEQIYKYALVVGKIGWRFTTIEPASQPIINAFCLINTAAPPDQVAAEAKKALQELWTKAANTQGDIAIAVVLAIDTLWEFAGASDSTTLLTAVALVNGVCDGVGSAQGLPIPTRTF